VPLPQANFAARLFRANDKEFFSEEKQTFVEWLVVEEAQAG
jgi:hypothetical protein